MGILDSAVLLLQAKNYSGTGEWLDESGNGHHAQLGSTGGEDTNDPQFLSWDGENYVYMPGTASNYLSIPYSAALDITGDIDLRWCGAMDWTDSAWNHLIAKRDGGWSYELIKTSLNTIRLQWHNGTTWKLFDSDVLTYTDGQVVPIRATLDVSSGDVKIYDSSDGGDTWDQIKAGSLGATVIQASNDNVEIGSRYHGLDDMLTGFVLWAQIYAGIDGTLVLDVNLDDATEPFATFTERSSEAATVTINRSGSGLYIVDQASMGQHTNDYFEIADHADLDFAANEAFTVMALIRSSTIAGGNAVLVGKKDDLTTSVGWSLYRAAAAGTILIGDGSADDTDTASSLVARTAATVAGVRNISDDDIEAFLDGTGSGSSTADSTTATLANALPLRIGATSDTAASFFNGEIMAVVLWRSALSDAEIAEADAALVSVAATIVTPAVIAATSVLPTPSLTAAAVVTPNVIAGSFTVPTPAVLAAAVVIPSSIAIVAAAPGATITIAPTVQPNVIGATTTIPPPSLTAAAVVTPTAIDRFFTVPMPAVLVAPTVTPAVISTALVLPAPTVVVPALVAPAAIVTSLSVPTPTPTVPGPVQVDTSPQSTATIRSSGRKILRTSNGTIWVLVPQASDTVPRLRYSTDDGANWSTSSTAFSEAIDSRNAAWVFCSDGNIYMLYELADGSAIKVRRGILNGGHTDITWSSAVTVHAASNVGLFDLAVHEEDGDTYVHVVYGDSGTLCEYKRSVWPAAFGSTQVLTTWSGYTSPRIDFHHTQADVTAVQSSTPHIYVSWYENNKIIFRKNVFSSGPSWAWNSIRTITTDAKAYQSFAMSFDGSDVVLTVESLGTAEALLVIGRDAADTTTTSLANTPTRDGTVSPFVDITYNPDRDIEIFHTDNGAKVLQRVTYDRSGSSWGSWVTVDADADDLYPQVKLGYWSGSKANAVEVIWMDSSPDPDAIMYERFTFVISATVTPGVIALTSTLSAPTPSIAATTTPSVVAALSTLPAPTIGVTLTVTPNVVVATSAFSAPSITIAPTVTPSVVASISTLPTPTVQAAAIVVPNAVVTISTLPTPIISLTGGATPALITTISTLPTPTVYWSWTLKAGFDTARFYRLGATQLILVRGISRSAAVGYSAKESWATCSGAFAVPSTRAAQVVTAVQAVWAANTGASDAALTLLVNEALNDAGYRKPNGAVIS